MYWSAEVMLSRSERYLWATSRAQSNTTYPGYVSAFLLSGEGQIIKRMFMVPTTTVGGWANAISPAPWSDEYAAMADHPTVYVQMFKMEGRQETEHGVEYTTATRRLFIYHQKSRPEISDLRQNGCSRVPFQLPSLCSPVPAAPSFPAS